MFTRHTLNAASDQIAEISNDGTDGRPSNVAGYFISGGNNPTFNFKGDFTEKRYATKELLFNTTGDLLFSGSDIQTVSAVPSLGSAADNWRAADMTLETVWESIGRPSGSAQDSGFIFAVDVDTVDDVFFNWAETGPVSSVNVSVVGHTDYPTVAWSNPSGSVMIPSDETFEIVRIGPMPTNFHRFQPDGLVQSVRMTSGTGEDLGLGGDAEFTCLVDGVPTQFTSQTTCTSDEIQFNSPTSFFSNIILTPRERDTPAYVYYRIERTTCLTTSSASAGLTEDPALNVTFTLDYQSIEGECMDYTDCYVDGDDHPSLRTSFSSTGNTNKMIQCVGMPKRSNPDLIESRCMECTSDCHCPGGSYCHRDNGVCNDGVRNYLCDGDSHRMAGVCKVKDAAKEIIGKPCRVDRGGTYGIVQSRYRTVNNPSTALIVSEGTADDRSDGITGGGFCGEARYYNSSNVDFTLNNVKRSGAARVVLWDGQCVSGVCQECSDGEVQCASSQTGNGGDKTCIRGRLRDTIIVDQTIRTFTSNTVAGTALSGVMMIIVVQIIFVVYFVVERGDAHRQEEEAKEEKKKEKAEKKAEKARKELAAHDGKVVAKEGGKKKGAGASESKED